MRHPRTLWVSALAVLALASPLRADLIAWSYTWSSVPNIVPSDPPGVGGLSLTNDQGSAVGNSEIVATNIKSLSSANPGNPDVFANGGQYKLFLTITDTTSQQSGTVEFDGKLSGTISSGSAQITDTFTSSTTQTLTLGGNVYTVNAENFLPPGPPGAANSGGIGASVEVAAEAPGGNPGTSGADSPEPSSLLLCGLGAAGCAFAGWRRRRVLARLTTGR